MKLVKEKDLPGIGRKYMLDARSGDKLVVIVHDDGRRELYHFYHEDPNESISMVTLDDEESRCIASILGGMAYRPRDLDTVEVALGDMVLEWYKIENGAFAIGKTIGDMQIRKRTGGTIIAMVRENQNKTINPDPQLVLEADATVVILGEREQVRAAKKLIFNGSVD